MKTECFGVLCVTSSQPAGWHTVKQTAGGGGPGSALRRHSVKSTRYFAKALVETHYTTPQHATENVFYEEQVAAPTHSHTATKTKKSQSQTIGPHVCLQQEIATAATSFESHELSASYEYHELNEEVATKTSLSIEEWLRATVPGQHLLEEVGRCVCV